MPHGRLIAPAAAGVATRRAWLRRQALLLALAAIALLLTFETTRLDLRLAAPLFDPASGEFPLRRHWFFNAFMHDQLKLVATGGAVAVLGLCALGMRGRLAWLPPRGARLAAIGMLLIPAATSALKHLTNRHCPWDVIEFGGFAPYVGLLQLPAGDIAPGACFPAGHASLGFLWLIWAVALRATSVRAARIAGALAAAFGLILGVGQMLRGAHFLSHTLWSLWLAWAICIALAAALPTRSTGRGPTPPPART
ncbi:MAG: phosphatase PAP2 family protein [Rhodocyclales bacterium]|nr:phosphatase PAP2 family protein [Rhodocyclales bacterium]